MQQKIKIQNRKSQNIMVLIEETKDAKGLAFVMHGLSGYKEQPQIVAFAEAFKEKDFTVIRFDTTNTFGESDGDYEDATATNYFEDLEDVITWSQSQSWYQEPFYLAGASLGGISVLLYTEKYPEKVKGIAPISTVISGELSAQAHGEDVIDAWRTTGWKEEKSTSHPDRMKRLKWSHMVDRLQYDILPKAYTLTMPVLLIVGENDTVAPVRHQKKLFDALKTEKEIHIIKHASHTFTELATLNRIKQIIKNWIGKVERENEILTK